MIRPRATNLVPVTLVLAALLVGCGSSSPSGVTPSAYVKSVCTSLGSWSTGVRTAGSQLQSAAGATNSLAKGKQEYQAFVAALAADTGRLVGELKTAGVPAVNSGKQIADALVQAFTQAQVGLSQAAGRAAAIPTTSAAAYQAGAAGVTISIRQTLAKIGTVRPQKDPQLRAASAKEPACQALKSA